MKLIELVVEHGGALHLTISPWLVAGVIGVALIVLVVRRLSLPKLGASYEIDEAEIGIGTAKVKIRPNKEDLQIAYRLWIELRTRKLALPIDEERDVIHEVYNSWYQFFGITRELIKSIPATKVRSSADTRILVNLAMGVLNEGLRPHLTTWQAKYRRWYDQQAKDEANRQLSPQEIQQKYGQYSAIVSDMKGVNSILVRYAEVLESMVHGVR